MWSLFGQLEKDANYKVFFGKKGPHELLVGFLCCYGVLTWLSIERTWVERPRSRFTRGLHRWSFLIFMNWTQGLLEITSKANWKGISCEKIQCYRVRWCCQQTDLLRSLKWPLCNMLHMHVCELCRHIHPALNSSILWASWLAVEHQWFQNFLSSIFTLGL